MSSWQHVAATALVICTLSSAVFWSLTRDVGRDHSSSFASDSADANVAIVVLFAFYPVLWGLVTLVMPCARRSPRGCWTLQWAWVLLWTVTTHTTWVALAGHGPLHRGFLLGLDVMHSVLLGITLAFTWSAGGCSCPLLRCSDA